MPSDIKLRRSSIDWLERAALTASFVCMVHCLALPLLFAALPMLSRALSLPESFHVWVVMFAVPTSGLALLTGWRSHRVGWPLVTGGLGLVLLAIGAFVAEGGAAETAITVAGSLTLAAGHLGNWRLRHARR